MSKEVTLILPPSNYKFDEAMKTLRTNLIFCGSNVRTVMFTSTKPNEGKTEVAFSVAASMAQMGKKVLFVDTDIRKSVLLNRYHLSVAVKGLSEYLSGQTPIEDVVCETNVENLHVIFAGSTAPNSAELLEEASFGTLLKEARAEYDYIIIDTPPVGTVIDGAVVGKQCDGVAIVTESGAVSYRALQKVKEQMERSGCRILGVVLNKVNVNKGSYYNTYYHKYGYGEYYGGTNKN